MNTAEKIFHNLLPTFQGRKYISASMDIDLEKYLCSKLHCIYAGDPYKMGSLWEFQDGSVLRSINGKVERFSTMANAMEGVTLVPRKFLERTKG